MLGYWFYDMTACCDFVSDQCLEVGNGTGNGLPSFQDYGRTGERINRYHQAIIPSYEFQCCGDIRVWAVDVHPGGRRDNRDYTLNLQVWRPSPALASSLSRYYLIGNNRFTSISLDDQRAIVTPSSQDYIQFRPGDVLGLYVEEARDDDDKGVVVLTDSSFTSELVWQTSIASQPVPGGCPISVGSSGDLNTMLRGAPVISISTGE